MARVLGTSIKRREDPALITGRGKYTDDLKVEGMTHAAIVRSPYAHARIRGIDTSAAEAYPGVLAVLTARDVAAAGIPGVVPVGWLLPDLKTPAHPMIAADTVRHVGDAVAVVVAEDRYIARDAADRVAVDYEPLDAVADVVAALEDGAPTVHEDAPGNVAFDWEIGDKDAVDAAFAQAAHTVELDLRNNRLIPHAIEARAVLASYDSSTGRMTIHMTTQNPHVHRLLMTLASLGMPEHKVRIVAPEVGGGFGSKIHHYADEAIVGLCSMKLDRPVKWAATRTETNLTDAHGRDHSTHCAMALDGDGRITGLKVDTKAAMGAYLSTFAPSVPTYLYGTLMSGQYDIPAIHCHVTGVFTHTAPVDAYRGAGRPEATFVVERLMHLAGDATGLGPVEVRKRNFVPPDAFPYQTQVALAYDSGNYAPAMDRALEMVGYDDLRREQASRRANGNGRRQLGIGFSSYIEACGLAPSAVVGSLGAQAGLWESADVRVHPTGSVTVYTGSSSHGRATRRRSPRSSPTGSASLRRRSRSSTATPTWSSSAWAPTAAAAPPSAARRSRGASTRSSRRARRSPPTCSKHPPRTSSTRTAVSGSPARPTARSVSATWRSRRTWRTTTPTTWSRASPRPRSTTPPTSRIRSAPTSAWSRSTRRPAPSNCCAMSQSTTSAT